MRPVQIIALPIFLLSFLHCLYKSDYLGCVLSLAFVPMCVMTGRID